MGQACGLNNGSPSRLWGRWDWLTRGVDSRGVRRSGQFQYLFPCCPRALELAGHTATHQCHPECQGMACCEVCPADTAQLG